MNVLWLNWRDIKHPWAGGAEVHLHEIVSRLIKKGYEITILSSLFSSKYTRLSRREQVNGYDVVRVGGNEKYLYAALRFLKSCRKDYDVIIEDINKVPIYAPIILGPTKRMLGIVHHLNRRVFFEELPLMKAIVAYILETFMPIIYTRIFKVPFVAVSEDTKKELIKLGADPKKIHVIYNGIDHSKYYTISNNILSGKYDEPTIIHLGRLMKYKRPQHCLKAFEKVQKEIPDARLMIVGSGELSKYLRRMIKEKKSSNVIFIGWVDEDKKIELLQKSWLNIQASEREGWGLTVIESACCGTPTIAYDNPGLRNAIIDKKTGILVRDGDIKKFAEYVILTLKNKEYLKRLSENAKEYSKRFSWETCSNEFHEYIVNMRH